jgi:hypothetical protein
MTIHVLVEGQSEFALLERWSPRLLRGHPVRIHPHQGKGILPNNLDAAPQAVRRGLLDQLPAKLRGFANSLDPAVDGVVVLVDADDQDPTELSMNISKAAQRASPNLRVAVHLAVEETEAFYLGDLKALRKAFPYADMASARAYAPDSICGTWELFGKIVKDGGGNKVAWAEAMGPVLTTRPGQSRSPSFQALVKGMLKLLPSAGTKKKPRRPYRHIAKTRTDPSGWR